MGRLRLGTDGEIRAFFHPSKKRSTGAGGAIGGAWTSYPLGASQRRAVHVREANPTEPIQDVGSKKNPDDEPEARKAGDGLTFPERLTEGLVR